MRRGKSVRDNQSPFVAIFYATGSLPLSQSVTRRTTERPCPPSPIDCSKSVGIGVTTWRGHQSLQGVAAHQSGVVPHPNHGDSPQTAEGENDVIRGQSRNLGPRFEPKNRSKKLCQIQSPRFWSFPPSASHSYLELSPSLAFTVSA